VAAAQQVSSAIGRFWLTKSYLLRSTRLLLPYRASANISSGHESRPAKPGGHFWTTTSNHSVSVGRLLHRADYPLLGSVRIPGAGPGVAAHTALPSRLIPPAEWTARQLRNPFPWDSAPLSAARSGSNL
jgi:hypothetical protein